MSSGRPATLPRASRLRERGGYDAALAVKPLLVRRHCCLHVRTRADGGARLGVIVGRKVASRAVDRNRIKRLIREVFRQQRWLLGNHDLVIRVRRCPSREGWGTLRREVAGMFGDIARLQEGKGG